VQIGTDPAALLGHPVWGYPSIPTAAVLQAPQNDLGLLLYREPRSRKAVENFYTALTGNREISLAILRYADANEIPLPLAFALAWGESAFNPRAYNRNAQSVDRGLFQLNSSTFPSLKVEQFYDPQINARFGLEHLRFCLNQAGSELVALAIYNAGVVKVRRGTPYSTLNHIARILAYRDALKKDFQLLLEGSPLLDHLASRIASSP